MTLGLLAAVLMPGLFDPVSLRSASAFLEISAEIVVMVLFSIGLRIANSGSLRLWRPTIRLLAVTMPLAVAVVIGVQIRL